MYTSAPKASVYANKTEADLLHELGELQQEIATRNGHFFPELSLDFRTLVENSEDIITLIDSDGIVRYQSPAIERVLGYSPAEHIGTYAVTHVHPDDVDGSIEVLAAAAANPGVAFAGSLRAQHKDGSWIDLETSGRAITYAGSRVAIVLAMRDVTELKISQNASRLSEQRLAKLFKLSPSCISVTEVGSGIFVDVNEAWCRIFGYSRDEVIGQSSIELKTYETPEDRSRIIAALHTDNHIRNMELNFCAADGTILSTLYSAEIIEIDTRDYILSVVTDITDLKETERVLRVREQALEAAQEIGQLGHWRMFPATGQVEFSDELMRIYGIDAGRAIPSIEELTAMLLPAERSKVEWEHNYAAILRGERIKFDFRMMRPDGEIRHLKLEGRPELDETGDLLSIFGVVHDITDIKKLEEQLGQSQKLEALGKLSGGIAHDFNNVLAVIVGSAELIALNLPKDSPSSKLIDDLIEAANRGADLTHRLLAFSRKQTLDPKVVRLDERVDAMIEMLQRTLGETITIETHHESRLWSCLVDPGQVENALLNLAINARDAMPGGGRLTVDTANVCLGEDFSTVDDFSPGPYVKLSVSDSGIGIEPDALERVFEPFYTTKARDKGTGLGLSMIFGFVKQSKGHVTIESELNIGTTVNLFLPRTLAEPHEMAIDAPMSAGAGETILLVEDDPLVRTMAVELLQTLGYRVHNAADGSSALALLKSVGPIDLLLTDVRLPGGMSGPEIAEAATQWQPGIPILYMSGYTGDDAPGANDLVEVVLAKPFRKEQIARRVREALQSA